MNILLRAVFYSFACCFLTFNLSFSQDIPHSKPIDKKFKATYSVTGKEVNKTGKEENLEGKVTIKNGLISSTFSKLNGFSPSICTFNVDSSSGEKVITFYSESPHPNGGKLIWTGTIRGNTIDGKASRDDTGSVYYYTGTKP